MKCPKCGAEMEFVDTDDLAFYTKNEILVETSYHCEKCKKSFLYNEHFKRNDIEFCCEVED